jgi:hypothetical protein
LDGGEEEPSGGAFDGAFEVLGEAAVAVEPSECPLDDPSSGKKLEALGRIRTLDEPRITSMTDAPAAVSLDAVMGRRLKSSHVGWLSLRMMVLKRGPSDRPQAS